MEIDRKEQINMFPNKLDKLDSKQLNEELVEAGIWTTDSAYQCAARIKNSKISLRILWVKKLNRYFICDANEFIHRDMADKAFYNGYFAPIGVEHWELDEFVDSDNDNVVHLITCPKELIDDTWGAKPSEDGYKGQFEYDNFVVSTRNDDGYKKCPLAKTLGKYKRHIKMDGWQDDYTPKIIQCENLIEDTRTTQINKSKNTGFYKDQSRGKNRWERKKYSKIGNAVKQYNAIDMNNLFKKDILQVDIPIIGETDAYSVTIKMEGVIAEVQKNIKNNKNKLEFRTIAQALTKIFNTADVYTKCTCLDKDTKLKLLDGTTDSIEKIKQRFDAGEKLFVYSVDENGDFKPGEVENVWVSGKRTDFIKITLDNGKEIITTPDHKYMLRDGNYQQADQLAVGQSLMPLYKIAKIEIITKEYTEEVYDIKVKNCHNFLVDAGVILHNCSDFKYNYAHWNIINNVSVDDTSKDPGPGKNIRNANDDKGRGCKHILLILNNGDWMIKVASVINNYIHYAEEHLQKPFLKVIFPKLYGIVAEDVVTADLIDDDKYLDSSKGMIDAINEYGKNRGKYKPGTNRNPINDKRNNKEDTENSKD